MSEAPAEVWMRERPAPGHGWYQTALAPLEGADAVRYVRADLYEALQARLWARDVPFLEPLPPDAGSHEQQPSEAMAAALRALRDASGG